MAIARSRGDIILDGGIIARSFFESGIPESTYESATIDGAGWLRCYTRFAIPLSKPMIAVLTLFFALGTGIPISTR